MSPSVPQLEQHSSAGFGGAVEQGRIDGLRLFVRSIVSGVGRFGGVISRGFGGWQRSSRDDMGDVDREELFLTLPTNMLASHGLVPPLPID